MAERVYESPGYGLQMEWVRRWSYELVWHDGHTGVRSRDVDTVDQLRAVITWARANPRVRRYSFQAVYRLIGDPTYTDTCPAGHPLVTYPRPHRVSGWLTCAVCPGHRLTVCPTCSTRLIEPPPGADCGPPLQDP